MKSEITENSSIIPASASSLGVLPVATLPEQALVAGESYSLEQLETLVEYFLSSEDVKPSSRSTYKRQLKQFFLWVNTTKRVLSQLDRRDIIAYSESLKGKGLSNLSVGGYLTAVRKFYSFLETIKLFPNIAAKIKSPAKKNRVLKMHLREEEIKRILATAKASGCFRDYVIISLLLRTGIRGIEATRINLEDFTYRAGRRVLMLWRKGKNSKEDFVVVSPKLEKLLTEYIAKERAGAPKAAPLFVSYSNRNKVSALSQRTISRIGRNYLDKIELTGREYSTHSFRHTAGVELLKKTKSIEAVQAVLGHSSPKTSQIYVESIKEELRLQEAPELLLDKCF